MKQIGFLILFITCSTISLKAQTTQDFLNSCVDEERIRGARNVIINANICNVCMTEPILEGYLFIKDSINNYKVRYLKYKNGFASVDVLKDSTYLDVDVQEIFNIVEIHEDSIIEQLNSINELLRVQIIKNGEKLYGESITHGKMRYVGLINENRTKISLASVLNLNDTFNKAYYYWLLISSINNYIEDRK